MTDMQPRYTRMRASWLLSAVAALLGAIVVGVMSGSVWFAPHRVLLTLLDSLPGVHLETGLAPIDQAILTQLRLPRVMLAALVGAALALGGASYQGVFRNPLVDPYLLGSAAGAGLGATLAISYAPASTVIGVPIVPLAAFVGALFGVTLAYLLGSWASGGPGASSTGISSSVATLMLAGVAVAAFLTALQAFVQQQNTEKLQQIYGWIVGRLGGATWTDVATVAPYLALSTVAVLLHSQLLDVLALGDDEAASLGVPVTRVRIVVLLAASLATGAAVAVSGLIGFIGLVVPHVVRRLTCTSYRVVLPLSLLVGATLLVLADVIARSALSGSELPVGLVTAFLGAPFFAGLLRLNRRSLV
ncbi:MAG: ABC transporter permease [Acidimicrobiales bacterium]|nr:MAG: ABC transporter permease [Acidimicrobiales bacterium]